MNQFREYNITHILHCIYSRTFIFPNISIWDQHWTPQTLPHIPSSTASLWFSIIFMQHSPLTFLHPIITPLFHLLFFSYSAQFLNTLVEPSNSFLQQCQWILQVQPYHKHRIPQIQHIKACFSSSNYRQKSKDPKICIFIKLK